MYFCFVDLLSLVLSKKEIDVSSLTELVTTRYSTLYESTFELGRLSFQQSLV